MRMTPPSLAGAYQFAAQTRIRGDLHRTETRSFRLVPGSEHEKPVTENLQLNTNAPLPGR